MGRTPLPLVGRGWGSLLAFADAPRTTTTTPHPNPPPQGGREESAAHAVPQGLSTKHARRRVALHLPLTHTHQLAEHEIVVRAQARGGAKNVAGRLVEIEAREAVGLVADFRMAPHPPMPARLKLRVGEQ